MRRKKWWTLITNDVNNKERYTRREINSTLNTNLKWNAIHTQIKSCSTWFSPPCHAKGLGQILKTCWCPTRHCVCLALPSFIPLVSNASSQWPVFSASSLVCFHNPWDHGLFICCSFCSGHILCIHRKLLWLLYNLMNCWVLCKHSSNLSLCFGFDLALFFSL